MVRKHSEKAGDVEERLTQAIIAMKTGSYENPGQAAKLYGVYRTTLNKRLTSGATHNTAQELQQILSVPEETVLRRWISQLTIAGYSYPQSVLREMVEVIMKQHIEKVNDVTMVLVRCPAIGIEWIYRFKMQHPMLCNVRSIQIDLNHWTDPTVEVLRFWCDTYKNVLVSRKININNVYNMDEIGFGLGVEESSRVIIDNELRMRYKLQPGRQEWVSVVESICADGSLLLPFIIVKAKGVNSQWITKDTPNNWYFRASSTGSTSNVHGLEWLRSIFEPFTCEKANGQSQVLVYDSHDSHISRNFIEHCMTNNIILLVMPPHSSQLTQPLDISVFGPLKQAFASAADRLTRTGIRRIQRTEWVELYQAARTKAMQPSNVKAVWLGASLHPYNPLKAIGRIPALEAPITPQLQATTMDSLMDISLLTSSPPDGTTMHLSNAMLCAAVESLQPLSEPARQYISHLTNTAERLETENTILRKEKSDKDVVLEKRQVVKTRKRVILKGVVLVSTAEIRNKIVAAEVETLAKAANKATKKHLSIVVESDEDSSEVLDETESVDDCITVERL